LKKIERSLCIHAKRIKREVPRCADIAPSAQVVHDIGLTVGEESINSNGVKKVWAIGTVDSNDGVALKI
jgi:hypothetical protein